MSFRENYRFSHKSIQATSISRSLIDIHCISRGDQMVRVRGLPLSFENCSPDENRRNLKFLASTCSPRQLVKKTSTDAYDLTSGSR